MLAFGAPQGGCKCFVSVPLSRVMKIRHFHSELWFPHSIDTVFAVFGDARNLDLLTPPWLHFRILTPEPIEMGQGTVLDYRLRIHGIPVRWCSEITLWEPPDRFVDVQRKGPYLQWIHTHNFVEMNDGTLMQDQVEYALHGWILESWVDALLVRSDLKKIFKYREEKLKEFFASKAQILRNS